MCEVSWYDDSDGDDGDADDDADGDDDDDDNINQRCIYTGDELTANTNRIINRPLYIYRNIY